MAQRTTPKKKAAGGDEGGDRFDMLQSGKCVLVIDGEVFTFRRPKLGEFRRMREALFEREDNILRATAESNVANQAEEADQAETPEKVETVAALNDVEKLDTLLMPTRLRQRALSDTIIDLNAAWVADSLGQILEGDRTMPAADDWPPEMVESTFLVNLTNHWRHVPLVPGGGATTPTP